MSPDDGDEVKPDQPRLVKKDKTVFFKLGHRSFQVQKEVFGMGYKNLPVLSIEEFYEQRVRDGWFPSADQVQQSLMDKAKQVGKLDSLL